MRKITFEDQVYTLEPGETVLAGLERQGVEIPSSCRGGVCQSCLLRAVEGAAPAASTRGVRETLSAQGYFLACSCVPEQDMRVERPGAAGMQHASSVVSVTPLNARTVELRLSRPAGFDYRAGQFVNLVRPGNIVRSYSLASVPDLDAELVLHIALMPGGKMSAWACDEAQTGDPIGLLGPLGACFYLPGAPEQPLFLFGTGTGLAPLYGILRDALARGHRAPIYLFHGSPVDAGIYLHDALLALADAHPHLHYHPFTMEAPTRAGIAQGDLVAESLAICPKLDGFRVYLCGNPDLVRAMQRKTFLAGASMSAIHADAFLPAAK